MRRTAAVVLRPCPAGPGAELPRSGRGEVEEESRERVPTASETETRGREPGEANEFAASPGALVSSEDSSLDETSSDGSSTDASAWMRTFSRGVFAIASGTLGAQVLLWISSPLLTRLFEPAHFGVLQLVTATAGVLNLVSTLRYELAIPLPGDEREARDLVVLCLVLNVAGTALIAVALPFIVPLLPERFALAERAGLVWFVPILVFVGGVTQVIEGSLTRSRRFGGFGKYRFTSVALGIVIQIGAWLVGFRSAAGLVAGKALGPAIAMLGLAAGRWASSFRPVAAQIDSIAEAPSIGSRLRALAIRYRSFPLFNTWASVANFVAMELPTWVLAVGHDVAAVGYFGIATLLVRAPMHLLGKSIAQVFLSEAASAAREGRLAELTARTFRMCAAVGAIPAVLFLALGRELILVFGPNWAEAGVYVEILAPVIFFRFLASPISQIFVVAERQREQVLLQFGQLAFTASIVLVASLEGSARGTLAAFAFAGVTKHLWFCWRLLGIAGSDRRRALRDLAGVVARCLPLLVTLLGAKWVLELDPWILLALAAVGTPLTLRALALGHPELSIGRLLRKSRRSRRGLES
jgi:lipopolysaccharide exporter